MGEDTTVDTRMSVQHVGSGSVLDGKRWVVASGSEDPKQKTEIDGSKVIQVMQRAHESSTGSNVGPEDVRKMITKIEAGSIDAGKIPLGDLMSVREVFGDKPLAEIPVRDLQLAIEAKKTADKMTEAAHAVAERAAAYDSAVLGDARGLERFNRKAKLESLKVLKGQEYDLNWAVPGVTLEELMAVRDRFPKGKRLNEISPAEIRAAVVEYRREEKKGLVSKKVADTIAATGVSGEGGGAKQDAVRPRIPYVEGQAPVKFDSMDIRGKTFGPEDMLKGDAKAEPRELVEGRWCGVYVPGEKPGTYTQVEYLARGAGVTGERIPEAVRPLLIPFSKEKVVISVPTEVGTNYYYFRPTTGKTLVEERVMNSLLANLPPDRVPGYPGVLMNKVGDGDMERLETEGYKIKSLKSVLYPTDSSRYASGENW